MLVRIINRVGNDMKTIGRSPVLLIICMGPLFLILIMLFGFAPLSDYILKKSGFDLDIYYTLIAITLASSIPLFPGLVYSFIPDSHGGISSSANNAKRETITKELIFSRMISSSFLSLIMVFCFIILTVPVTSQGWLRSLFIIIFLSLQTVFIFMLISCFSVSRARRITGLIIYALFITAVPLGLMFHHPWNYLAFFSPLYWIAWSWVITQPLESMLYGAISILITAGGTLFLCRHLYKRILD